jgi:hypothetical protein
MDYVSSLDENFLKSLQRWLSERGEVLVLIRYSRSAGSKSFEFFDSYHPLLERLRRLPEQTSIIAFRKPQLPLRGVVDDQFVADCLSRITDGSEFLVVEMAPRTAGKESWTHHAAGISNAELRNALEDARGRSVAVGAYPPWEEKSPDVLCAIVPDECGVVKTGAY